MDSDRLQTLLTAPCCCSLVNDPATWQEAIILTLHNRTRSGGTYFRVNERLHKVTKQWYEGARQRQGAPVFPNTKYLGGKHTSFEHQCSMSTEPLARALSLLLLAECYPAKIPPHDKKEVLKLLTGKQLRRQGATVSCWWPL